MANIRTDLVYETMESAAEQGTIDGIISQDEENGNIRINRITIETEAAAMRLSKKPGRYVTVFCDHLLEADGEDLIKLLETVGREIRTLLGDKAQGTLLVVGLGNDSVTPDALGPYTVDNVVVSRHIKSSMQKLYEELKLGDVAAVTPGVLGQTGVESFEIIKGLADRINPAAIIAIDSLMARKMERLASTVQLSDTGIVPGSGLNNNRSEISESTMGMPVISMGIPMVIDASTLAKDMLKDEEKADETIRSNLTPFEKELIVTPKQIDAIAKKSGKVLGYSINKAMHQSLTIEDMNSFLA